MNETSEPFSVLNTADGSELRLAMQSLWVTGRIVAVGARLIVVHTFRSAERVPVEVVYSFGLPRDGALRRFKILGSGFQVRSELRPVAEANKAYERALGEGHLAGLARTYRDGRVNLTVGNLRPGEKVSVFLEMVAGVDLRDDGLRFRFPFCLAPCFHAEARAAEVEPGVGEMELPEDKFEDVLLPRWLTDGRKLHRVGFDLAVGMTDAITEIGSPSHTVGVRMGESGEARVGLARESDVPNRDLVLDVRTADRQVCVVGGLDEKGRCHATVVVPSACFGDVPATPRNVVFLLDKSGSMQGVPLTQARNALGACLAALRPQDQFGIVAFGDDIAGFSGTLLPALKANRDRARAFLEGIEAGGGTILTLGFKHAASVLGSVPGDVFVLTDGQVGETESILAEARRLHIRLNCLGIGAASQDRFLNQLARETGGVGRFVTPGERVDLAALELFTDSGKCVADNLSVRCGGAGVLRVVGTPSPRVFAGHPLVLMLEAEKAEGGLLELEWVAGGQLRKWSSAIAPNSSRDAGTVRLLQGARLITDLDARLQGELHAGPAERRTQGRQAQKLEDLGRLYGLANRALSLVAVVERRGDDATRVPRTLVVPVGFPEGVHPEAYLGGGGMDRLCAMPSPRAAVFFSAALEQEPQTLGLTGRKAPEPTAQDLLVSWVAEINDDGGLAGPTPEIRIQRSLMLLARLLDDGSSASAGVYRAHICRLATFLEGAAGQLQNSGRRDLVAALLERARSGRIVRPGLLRLKLEFLGLPGLPEGEAGWEILTEFAQRERLQSASGAG